MPETASLKNSCPGASVSRKTALEKSPETELAGMVAVSEVSCPASKAHGRKSAAKQLHDERIADVVLDPYPVKPYVLFFDDFTEDPEDWRNQGGSAYYGKNSLIVRPEGDGKELSWTID